MSGMTLVVIVAVVVGVISSLVDRTLGRKLYRGVYNLSHREPLAADVDKGLIYGQPARRKAAVAVLLAIALAVSGLFSGLGFVSGVAGWVVFFIITFACFYLGQFIYRLHPHTNRVFETIDDVEAGRTNLATVVRDVSTKIIDRATGVREGARTELPTETAVEVVGDDVPVVEKEEDLKPIDPAEAIGQFSRER